MEGAFPTANVGGDPRRIEKITPSSIVAMVMADFWYPSVEDVLIIHAEIVSEYPDTSQGIKRPGDIEFALQYIDERSFDPAPETIHEKAYHLLRLLVANHPFVDANKRTALNTTATFYFLNGYRFTYDDEIRTILKQFGTDQETVEEDTVVQYLEAHTESIDLAGEIETWRPDLVQFGLDELATWEDPND